MSVHVPEIKFRAANSLGNIEGFREQLRIINYQTQ